MASYQGHRLSQANNGTVRIPFNGGTFRCMEQGAVVRAGVEKTSAKVGDLPGFAPLVVVEKAVASCGTERLRVAEPARGWISAKIVEFTPTPGGAAGADAGAAPPPPVREDALRRHDALMAARPDVEYQFLKGLDYSPGGDSTTGFFVAPSDDGNLEGSDDGAILTAKTAFPDSGDDASEGALDGDAGGGGAGDASGLPKPLPRVSSGNLEKPASAFPRFGSGNLEVPVIDYSDDVLPTPITEPEPVPPARRTPKDRTFASMLQCCYSASTPGSRRAFSPGI